MISGRLAFFALVFIAGTTTFWILWSAVYWIFGSDQTPKGTSLGKEYSREAFGNWIDSDGNCLNTRSEILRDRSLSRALLDETGCRVVGGTWKDAYTGDLISNPEMIDVDHLVPLRFAWIAGASDWPESKRIAFMNDEENLILTAASINRSKSDLTPTDWLPPDRSAQCGFVQTFLSVVVKYSLALPDHSLIPDMERKVCN